MFPIFGDDAALVAEARKLGVHVHALGAYCASRPVRRGLLFGYGAIEEGAITDGLARLRRVLRTAKASL